MTDKRYYLQGEPVEISAKNPPGNGQEVLMTISNRRLSAENGSYNYSYIAGNPREYFVDVSSGSLHNATYFDVLRSYNIKIGDQNYNIGYDLEPEPTERNICSLVYWPLSDSISLPPCFIHISSNLATFSIIKFPLLSYNFIKLARIDKWPAESKKHML